MKLEDILQKMVENPGVSGFEQSMSHIVEGFFKDTADEIKRDKLGNLIAYKKGTGKNPIKVMLAAHMDEIGLMVTNIDKNGFIQFAPIGGVDQRTLLAQEVVIHGKNDVFGVIGAKPPHLQSPDEKKHAIKMEDMLIDVGLSKAEAEKFISIGDPITIKRNMIKLQNSVIASKAIDDKAGVAVMIECFKELRKLNHQCDVYAVATTQEEVGTRGAIVSTFHVMPDIGIAIDVGFGSTPELPKDETLDLGKGPGIGFGANMHPKIYERLTQIAEEYNIPKQMDLNPGMSGTDARAMQITQSGVATALLSIPLRYMHTSVETIDMIDIKNTAKLMAYFISSLDDEDLEGLLCF